VVVVEGVEELLFVEWVVVAEGVEEPLFVVLFVE
jgi:hypothetical protein